MKHIASIFLALVFLANLAGTGFAGSINEFSCVGVVGIPQHECEALVALYNNTNGPGWTNRTNWLVTNTPGNWYGVTVQSGHVVTVDLYSNQLTGSIPPALGNLVNLTELSLGSNQLTGSIPPALGNLVNLTLLSLHSNQLTGSIPPELGDLANLIVLLLDFNQLTGSIPPQLGNLTNLTRLVLSGNQLTGSIPLSFTSLVNLVTFDFQDTYLCEPTTPEFQAWKTTVEEWQGTGLLCEERLETNGGGKSAAKMRRRSR